MDDVNWEQIRGVGTVLSLMVAFLSLWISSRNGRRDYVLKQKDLKLRFLYQERHLYLGALATSCSYPQCAIKPKLDFSIVNRDSRAVTFEEVKFRIYNFYWDIGEDDVVGMKLESSDAYKFIYDIDEFIERISSKSLNKTLSMIRDIRLYVRLTTGEVRVSPIPYSAQCYLINKKTSNPLWRMYGKWKCRNIWDCE